MEHGIVEDWKDMERVWSHAYKQLAVQSEQHPVLLTEAPLNPRRNRERAAEIFFETFNVPAFFVSMQAILSLYASGETSGLVLDSGDGVTHVVPVSSGFAVPSAILRADLGGRDITRYLQLLLRRAGHVFHTTAELELVRTIKEDACYVAVNAAEEEKLLRTDARDDILVPYRLPDGRTIELGAERFRAPEALFRPDLLGYEWPGLHELVASAIKRVDVDLRAALWEKIHLAGGTTMLPGIGDRLLSELRLLAPASDVHIRIFAPKERRFTAWIGGSILSHLPTFSRMWVTSKEYQEEGAAVVHRKTFN
jgi:centractin